MPWRALQNATNALTTAPTPGFACGGLTRLKQLAATDIPAPELRGRPEPVLVPEISRHADPACQPLDRAPRSRLGDVFTPGRILVMAPAAEFLAVADPLDPLVLHQDDLHGASGKSVSAEHGQRRLDLGSPSKSQWHGASIIPLGCGLSVYYLWVWH
jgi:hypothetical protein